MKKKIEKIEKHSKEFKEIASSHADTWEQYLEDFDFYFKERDPLSKKLLKKKKKVLIANQEIEEVKEPISIFFFKPWLIKKLKIKIIPLSARQKHLKTLYQKYRRRLFWNERKDFFKTYFGKMLVASYLMEQTNQWIGADFFSHYTYNHTEESLRKEQSLRDGYYLKKSTKSFFPKRIGWLDLQSQIQTYQIFNKALRKGWIYENLLKERGSKNAIYFELDRPDTAFSDHFKARPKAPWIAPLVFKRWAYFGFVEQTRKETKGNNDKILKEYLRKRNPRREKRNKLYWWRMKLLFDRYKKAIRKKKAARIKQVLKKIYIPFYGNLTEKQFAAILKKKKRKKSKLSNRNEEIWSSLENRLDVVVYRLNLAPSLLWARRLIQEGSIFVTNNFSFPHWISMYSQIKHFSFPLKLRDPKNLYQLKYWNPNKKISKFKFLLKPIRKIHYLVKQGDLIQSAKGLTRNIFKNNARLFRKPIPKNLYTNRKIRKYHWKNSVKAPTAYTAFNWQMPKQETTAALFLYNPRFSDVSLRGNDRAPELFFRWVTL